MSLVVTGNVTLYRRGGKVTEWKGIAYGNSAKNGVHAARMAKAGISGPTPVFEGKFGFFDQVSGEFELDTGTFGGRRGTHKIKDVLQKRFSICTHAIPAVDCVMEIVGNPDVDWTDIQNVDVTTYSTAISHLADDEKWDPNTREMADHSLPYCVARTVIDGQLGLNQFKIDKIQDSDARQLMDRVTVSGNEQYDNAYGDIMPTRIEIETSDSTFEASVELPKGHPKRPLTDEEIRGKLSQSSEYSGLDVDIDALWEYVTNVEKSKSVTGVFERLQPS